MDQLNSRMQYIDRLKGLAILLVVMGHVFLYTYGQPDMLANRYITSFHVPLFMFVSGYLVYKENQIYTLKQLSYKLKNFLIPMFVVGLILTFTQIRANSVNDGLTIVKDFILDPGKNGYWYLMSLSVFYCSLQCFRLNKRGNVFIDVLIVLIIYAILSVGRHIVLHRYNLWNDPLCVFNGADFYPFFILGYFTRKYKWSEYLSSRQWFAYIAFTGYFVFFNMDFDLQMLNTLSERFVVRLCALIAVVAFFLKRESCTSKIESLLSYFGKNTLYIYVFHYFVIRNISFVPLNEWTMGYTNWILSIVLAFFVTIIAVGISIGIGKLIKKTVLHKLLFTY